MHNMPHSPFHYYNLNIKHKALAHHHVPCTVERVGSYGAHTPSVVECEHCAVEMPWIMIL